MVLHNSKWDKRAKGKYLKKHGLNANDVKKNDSDNTADHSKPLKVEEDQQAQYESHQHPDNLSQESQQEPELATNIDLPEIEQDEDEEELIKAHRVRQAQQYQEKVQRELESATLPKSGENSIFAQAEAGYERSKLNERVKKHIGRQAKQVDVDSDSDFDQFMDELSDSDGADESAPKVNQTQKIEVSDKQSELLDKLLG